MQSKDPFELFKAWFETAKGQDQHEPTSMTLASLNDEGLPSARVVLLKQYDENGFCFFTNYNSAKSQELVSHPKAALTWHWEKPEHRQIRVRGLVEKTSYEESNAYFQTRARGSQIGAWASPQSEEITSREELMARVKEMEEKFAEAETIPCPKHWGGFRVQPLSIEFWQAGEFRLHDRLHFSRESLASAWTIRRLAP